ncbi:cytochrome P450 [Nocardia wallacei]|uniref:cytochrome P450 n=1 Tax=Nocardia wallacei TaxID=480035 RepID=UPI0024584E03|nr:cytochrome P450 [Nocardia wallacei]
MRIDVPYGSPTEIHSAGVALSAPEFAADPHGAYRDLRKRYGSLAPVELAPGVPATLVLGYRAALEILNDEFRFPADPRMWQRNVPDDNPVKQMLEYRQNALRTAFDEHDRYRRALSCLAAVDLNRMERAVDRVAEELINGFCESGTADIRMDYALPLTFRVLSEVMGFPHEAAQRAYRGMVAVLAGIGAEEGNAAFAATLCEVIVQKRAAPGDDLISRLLASAEQLDDMEMVQQVALLYAAGTEPTANLILNTLRLALTDDRFALGLTSGTLHTRDAVDETLFHDPPLANFCVSYPRRPMLIDDVWLPAHQPVVISLAACNTDPAVNRGDRPGTRSHLAGGAGQHACPAQAVALVIAQRALDQLLDALPDLRPAVPVAELAWRPGPFHRALAALPVVFPPSAPMILTR